MAKIRWPLAAIGILFIAAGFGLSWGTQIPALSFDVSNLAFWLLLIGLITLGVTTLVGSCFLLAISLGALVMTVLSLFAGSWGAWAAICITLFIAGLVGVGTNAEDEPDSKSEAENENIEVLGATVAVKGEPNGGVQPFTYQPAKFGTQKSEQTSKPIPAPTGVPVQSKLQPKPVPVPVPVPVPAPDVSQTMQKFCIECGTPRIGDKKFCTQCGKKFD